MVKKHCSACQVRLDDDAEFCDQCGKPQEAASSKKTSQENPPAPTEPEVEAVTRPATLSLLSFAGWVYLISSIAGAVAVWQQFGTILRPLYVGSSVTRPETNPVAVGIACAIFLQGIIVGPLAHAVVSIAEDVLAIRHRLGRVPLEESKKTK